MAGSNRMSEHVQWRGKLVVNLQSLEFALRASLYNCETGWPNEGGPRFLENIAEGQQLEVTAFTNYDTLAKLIKKYNGEVEQRNPKLAVDPGIARIQDALAHGRIAGLSAPLSEPLRLIKYDKPVSGRVYVTDYCVLTKEWFDQKIKLVYESIKKISAADGLFRSQD